MILKILILNILLSFSYLFAFEFKVNKNYYMSKDNIEYIVKIIDNTGNITIGTSVENIKNMQIPFKLLIKKLETGIFKIDIFVKNKKTNTLLLKEYSYGILKQISKKDAQFYTFSSAAIMSYDKKNIKISSKKVMIPFSLNSYKNVCLKMNDIKQRLDMFSLDNGKYPSEAEGLQALVANPNKIKYPYYPKKSYVKKIPKDIWYKPFIYVNNGKKIEIISYGADGKRGGSGDNIDILFSECNK